MNTQIRAGYFFNETFGVDLGLGYLYGLDQTIQQVNLPGTELDIKARGRAYGLSASMVYKFTNNIYGRFGALIKVGGRTEAIGKADVSLPAGAVPGVPIETSLQVDFTQDYYGRLPLGFVGALGYKYDLNKKISLFVEAEYMGISVTRDHSKMENFSAVIKTLDGNTVADLSVDQLRGLVSSNPSLASLAPTFYNEITYLDELPLSNTDGSKQLSQKVPYSSFGFNIGFTYTFGK